ncbi:hypothetical protein B0H67DRAFT_660075 [Lasiosphaeris hirsuta]|uniref:Uncharacterized protein n=1 Tax=Lasiosphaeris hirsuta TaxID=260670 RepID=A0AA40E868_9PEZI|nr:hypothetical protein B0H67DRAFT_660075 [Lasiosphaeris hirsuta]
MPRSRRSPHPMFKEGGGPCTKRLFFGIIGGFLAFVILAGVLIFVTDKASRNSSPPAPTTTQLKLHPDPSNDFTIMTFPTATMTATAVEATGTTSSATDFITVQARAGMTNRIATPINPPLETTCTEGKYAYTGVDACLWHASAHANAHASGTVGQEMMRSKVLWALASIVAAFVVDGLALF